MVSGQKDLPGREHADNGALLNTHAAEYVKLAQESTLLLMSEQNMCRLQTVSTLE